MTSFVSHGFTDANMLDTISVHIYWHEIYGTYVTPQNPGVPLTTVNLWKPVCLIS